VRARAHFSIYGLFFTFRHDYELIMAKNKLVPEKKELA